MSHRPLGGMRGRTRSSSSTVPDSRRTAVAPVGPSSANRLLARPAPICPEITPVSTSAGAWTRGRVRVPEGLIPRIPVTDRRLRTLWRSGAGRGKGGDGGEGDRAAVVPGTVDEVVAARVDRGAEVVANRAEVGDAFLDLDQLGLSSRL